jgi:transposase
MRFKLALECSLFHLQKIYPPGRECVRTAKGFPASRWRLFRRSRGAKILMQRFDIHRAQYWIKRVMRMHLRSMVDLAPVSRRPAPAMSLRKAFAKVGIRPSASGWPVPAPGHSDRPRVVAAAGGQAVRPSLAATVAELNERQPCHGVAQMSRGRSSRVDSRC